MPSDHSAAAKSRLIPADFIREDHSNAARSPEGRKSEAIPRAQRACKLAVRDYAAARDAPYPPKNWFPGHGVPPGEKGRERISQRCQERRGAKMEASRRTLTAPNFCSLSPRAWLQELWVDPHGISAGPRLELDETIFVVTFDRIHLSQHVPEQLFCAQFVLYAWSVLRDLHPYNPNSFADFEWFFLHWAHACATKMLPRKAASLNEPRKPMWIAGF